MDADFEKEFRELIAMIPDLSDRVFLLLMIRDKPLDCQALALKILKVLYEARNR